MAGPLETEPTLLSDRKTTSLQAMGEWVVTEDGSVTLFSGEHQQHYHNRFGAFSESRQFYGVPACLSQVFTKNHHVWVLDPFFGLGYNTLIAADQFFKLQDAGWIHGQLTIVTFELDDALLEKWAELEPQLHGLVDPRALQLISKGLAHKIYYRTHDRVEDLLIDAPVIEGCRLLVGVGDLRQWLLQCPEQAFHLFFHDAFSPTAQPECWTQSIYEQYARMGDPYGNQIITYSAAAHVRQGMAEAGYWIYALPSGLRKTGTVAFNHPQDDAVPLPGKDRGLMTCRSGIPFIDNATLSMTLDELHADRAYRQSISTRPTSGQIHRQWRPVT